MVHFLMKLFLSLFVVSGRLHGISGQFSGEEWWNSVSPWNSPPSEGQATDPGGSGVGADNIGGGTWNPELDPNFQTLGVVGPAGISVVSDTDSATTGNAQNVPNMVPPPNEIASPPREQGISSTKDSVSSNDPQQPAVGSNIENIGGNNEAPSSGRRRFGGQGRRRNGGRSQNRSSVTQGQGTRPNRRGGRRRFGTSNQGTPQEVTSTSTDGNSGGRRSNRQNENHNSQNAGRRRFRNRNNRRPGPQNRDGIGNRNVQELNPGESTSSITAPGIGGVRRNRFGTSGGSNPKSNQQQRSETSRIQNGHNQVQTGTQPEIKSEAQRAENCDGKGGNVKDSNGKITRIISRHDCSLLEVIDSPLTGGHVVDPHTGELMFAVDQQSFLVSSSPSPSEMNRRQPTSGRGQREPVTNPGLTPTERQRARDQRRMERLQRQKERQQRRRERQQRRMEKQKLREERLRRKQERQLARDVAIDTPVVGREMVQRSNNNNVRNMGGRNQNNRRRWTTTTTTITTPTTTTTTTITTPTTTTTPTPPKRHRSSRRSRLQRIARPLNRQFGNLLSAVMPGLNQQLGLAPMGTRTNRRRTRRPRIRNINMGNLFNLFG